MAEKCSASLSIREMQIKSTLEFHFILVRIATIKNTNDIKHWGRCRWKREPHPGDGNRNWSSHYGNWISYDLAIPLLYTDLQESMSTHQKYLYTHVYCCTTHRSQDTAWAKHPSTDKQIKKMCYVSTAKFSPAARRTKSSLSGKQMELEIIMFSETSQAQKENYHKFSLILS